MPETSSAADVAELISRLHDEDGMRRQQARHALVARGKPAVPALVKALQSGGRTVRWEAAKALAACADASAAPALMGALEDGDEGVAWLAAMGLVRLRRRGLEAALEALTHRGDSPAVRTGAHHVLHEMSRQGWERICDPVIRVLEGSHAATGAVVEADKALQALRAE